MKSGKGGFTLVELMVVLAIVGIITASLIKMLSSMTLGHTTRNSSADLQQSVRAVMDLMAREIRMAGFSSMVPTRFGITEATDRELAFTVDWDDDGRITESHSGNGDIKSESDIISYLLDSDTHSLLRVTAAGTDSKSTQSILGGSGDPLRVVDLNFSYFDQQGLHTARREDISSVRVRLSADLPAGLKGRQTRVYKTVISCRNLGL